MFQFEMPNPTSKSNLFFEECGVFSLKVWNKKIEGQEKLTFCHTQAAIVFSVPGKALIKPISQDSVPPRTQTESPNSL